MSLLAYRVTFILKNSMTKQSTFRWVTVKLRRWVPPVPSGSASCNQENTPEQTSLLLMLLRGWEHALLIVPHCNPLPESTAFHQVRGRYRNPSTRRRWVPHSHWQAVLIQSDAAAGIDKELLWWVWELITYQSAACCLNIQNSPPHAIFSRELPYLTDVPNEWSNHFLL